MNCNFKKWILSFSQKYKGSYSLKEATTFIKIRLSLLVALVELLLVEPDFFGDIELSSVR